MSVSYAVRRLNPFAGVAQIVATDNARAISLDGQHWEIQVLAEGPTDFWGSINRNTASLRFFRFGNWSPDKGLSRVPINPIMDIGAMLSASEALIRELDRHLPEMPFELQDVFELWLLDRSGQPLALKMTATADENLAALQPSHWIAAPAHDRNLGRVKRDEAATLADELERLVRRASGPGMAIWFQREAPGCGEGRAVGEVPAPAGPLPATAFPALPLRHDWPQGEDQALISLWISWAAPRLLCLPYLESGLTTELQSIARSEVMTIDRLWRLYGANVDAEFIKIARVEAAIRHAAQTA